MKINARECLLKEIDNEEIAREFLEENHTQGFVRSKKSYGLFFNGELVQIATFGKPRFNKNYDWEFLRDCTKKDFEVRGGVSKLWKHFLKENTVHSCVCYSYPHKDNMYVNKYVDFCDFSNIKRARFAKKVYFEGIWGGKKKRIDKSILESQGVDRLLKIDQGQVRTNEQILLDLGFERKEEEEGIVPQVDNYFPFGILYRIDDLDDGSFYIGETIIEERWRNGYLGTGCDKWQNHLKNHPPIDRKPKESNVHHYKRTIIKDSFRTPKELYDAEVKEIRKYAKQREDGRWVVIDPKCKNVRCYPQRSSRSFKKNTNVCSECGCSSNHKKTCSKYKRKPCEECGSIAKHKKWCSHYREVTVCLECGGKGGHFKGCSKYNTPKACDECGCIPHKSWCSKSKRKSCPECGSIGVHKYECSRANKEKYCKYCKTPPGGHHKKTCPNYVVPKNLCEFCGTPPGGMHKRDCPNYKDPGLCSECGYNLRSHKHAKTCSKHKK